MWAVSIIHEVNSDKNYKLFVIDFATDLISYHVDVMDTVILKWFCLILLSSLVIFCNILLYLWNLYAMEERCSVVVYMMWYTQYCYLKDSSFLYHSHLWHWSAWCRRQRYNFFCAVESFWLKASFLLIKIFELKINSCYISLNKDSFFASTIQLFGWGGIKVRSCAMLHNSLIFYYIVVEFKKGYVRAIVQFLSFLV